MFKSKFAFAYFFVLAMLFLFQPFTPAQTVNLERNDNAVLVSYDENVDSTNTVTSDWFSIPEYLSHSLYTYPINYTKLLTSAHGKPHVTTTIEGSNDQINVVVVDTVGNPGDSLETLYSGNTNFNNKKFWYYRTKSVGTGTGNYKNRSDTIINLDLVFIKPKN